MFKIHSDYKPTGDQPKAIEYLSNRDKRRKAVSDTSWCYGLSEKPLQWQI